ncbi:MAG: pre-peptidase [Planctomycetota bacterium]
MSDSRKILAAVVFLLPWVTGSVRAQTSYPMITHAVPLAVERGKTSELTIHGQMNFAGAFDAFVDGSGVVAKVVTNATKEDAAKPTNAVRLTVEVDAKAELGAREFRVATAQGVSSVGLLVVTDHPVIVESGEHASTATAMPIPVGSMVSGIIGKAEEVDVYKIAAKAGQRIVCEVEAARLMDKIHDLQTHFDPVLTLLDGTGREIANSDDTYFADPMLSHEFAQAGDYYLTIRDVTYAGDARWNYALLITDRPYVQAVHPMAGAPGTSVPVEAVGFNLSPDSLKLEIPSNVSLGKHFLPVVGATGISNGVPIEVTKHPVQLEMEPNDRAEESAAIAIPSMIAGRIESPSDVDRFRLDLKKGDGVRLEVRARRYGSALDSDLRLLDSAGNVMTVSDDGHRTKDSLIYYRATADGPFFVEIRDLLRRGGKEYPYLLDVRSDNPDFELICDDDKAGLGPGTAAPWFLRVTRRGGFEGPIEVRVEGLPPGVAASPLVIPATMTEGCIVLEAATNATQAFAPVRVIGKATVAAPMGGELVIERTANPIEEIYVPGGGRGVMEVGTQVVAVHPNFDLEEVTVTPSRLSLKPGETVKLEVVVKRREQYKGRITIDPLLRHLGTIYANPLPPGVTMDDEASKTSLEPEESKGTVILKVDPSAKPIDNVPMTVMANVSINFVVKRAYASRPVLLSIADPAKSVAESK